jgi:hypothetical protein
VPDDNDSDEVFTSVRRMPMGNDAESYVRQTVSRMAKRLELAEKVADMLVEHCASADGFMLVEDSLEEALVAWEEARGLRFIYTDGQDHIIATGRGGLSRWLAEQGYDTSQSEWELLQPDDKLSIQCDEDGEPCDFDEGIPIEKTAKDWLEQIKTNGLLCSEDV